MKTIFGLQIQIPLTAWLTAMTLAVPHIALAQEGGAGPGGGDPMVQQFIVQAKRLAVFYKLNPYKQTLPFSAEAFQAKVDQIDKSLKDEKAKDLLEFTDKVLKNGSGTEKVAIFHRETSLIQVNRGAWLKYRNDAEGRLTLITMEIGGLIADQSARYEDALRLVQGRGAVIMSIPESETNETDLSKRNGFMHIAGQDVDQFGRITTSDVLIDAGVVGKGLPKEQRVDAFFENPAADKEWFALIQKAWKNDRPAYLLLIGPDGSTGSIVSIYPTKYEDGILGVGTYSLIFRKHRQIYDGACAGEAQGIPALERITACYLNGNHYALGDTQSEGKGDAATGIVKAAAEAMKYAKGSILYYLAYDPEVLRAAVRDNYLPNYSSLLIGLYEARILQNTLRANGFVPQLTGSFPAAAFWARTPKQDLAAIRSNNAMKTIAEAGLSLMDSGTTCTLGAETDKGPKLIPVAKMRNYRKAQKACSSVYYSLPRQHEGELFATMVKSGFYYDYAAKTWRQDATASK